MLFLPAAALCCLCSALVAMAAGPVQDDLTLTRRVGQSVSFTCGTDQCYWDIIYWYQKKEMETFRLINGISMNNCGISSGYNRPQKADFSTEKTQNGCLLKLNRVKLDHSATYYCMCWKEDAHRNWYRIFGPGSKLYVTDEQVVKPVVSVYPAASRVHLGGGSSLLCVASAMFPPGVRFSWKRQKENGPLEDVPPAEGEQVELREPGRSASIMVVHRLHQDTYRYSCYVKHEGGTVEAQTQELPAPAAPCPPEREPADLPAPADPGSGVPAPADPGSGVPAPADPGSGVPAPADPGSGVPAPADPGSGVPAPADPGSEIFQSECRVKLLCLLYTVLTLKSLLYCCGLSLLMVLRNKGPSTN
ncbi:immunoglobulin lambda-1 light chain-like [Cololabis saira]|uniref:immunoglobulin lambda-1 light chain-like n=1 Tax=Cololabis saira TaxID=129043 RepID=UPI002AD39AB1|nr:immunoglobulin lambda-1 light chain-like [Cololabis saira]